MEGKQWFLLKRCHSFCHDIYRFLSQEEGDIFLLSPCMTSRVKTHSDKININFGIESQWASNCSGSQRLLRDPPNNLFYEDSGSVGGDSKHKDEVSSGDQERKGTSERSICSRCVIYENFKRKEPLLGPSARVDQKMTKDMCVSHSKKCLLPVWVACFNF